MKYQLSIAVIQNKVACVIKKIDQGKMERIKFVNRMINLKVIK